MSKRRVRNAVPHVGRQRVPTLHIQVHRDIGAAQQNVLGACSELRATRCER